MTHTQCAGVGCVLAMIPGERAWIAADRACNAPPCDADSRAHYDAIAKAGPVWAEIDEAAYWDALECLPPAYFKGGFAVSEPVTDDAQGRTVFLCIVTKGGRHFARYSAIVAGLADEVRS